GSRFGGIVLRHPASARGLPGWQTRRHPVRDLCLFRQPDRATHSALISLWRVTRFWIPASACVARFRGHLPFAGIHVGTVGLLLSVRILPLCRLRAYETAGDLHGCAVRHRIRLRSVPVLLGFRSTLQLHLLCLV